MVGVKTIAVSEEVWRRLNALKAETGARSISEVLERLLGGGEPGAAVAQDRLAALEAAVAKLREEVSAVLDGFREVAQLSGRVEELERRVAELEKQPDKAARQLRERSASEILREEGFAFEPLLKLRDPDAFFGKLKEAGAVVVELRGGRLAVDPQLWDRLSKILSGAGPGLPREVQADPRLEKLFDLLSKQGGILYAEGKGWVLPKPA